MLELQLDETTMYYRLISKGLPFTVIHGSGSDHWLMKGCLEPFFRHRKGCRRIYPNLLGMGETLAEEWIVNFDQMLEVVLEFVNKVAPNQRITLAGE